MELFISARTHYIIPDYLDSQCSDRSTSVVQPVDLVMHKMFLSL